MKKTLSLILVLTFFIFSYNAEAQEDKNKENLKIDYRIDNMDYHVYKSNQSLVKFDTFSILPAVFKGSAIDVNNVNTKDSPDIPVSEPETNIQMENSVFVNPTDNSKLLISNNSGSWDGSTMEFWYGPSYFTSSDSGQNWTGNIYGMPSTYVDPSTAIDLNGRYYLSYTKTNGTQAISHSEGGINWAEIQIGEPGYWLDKNNLWVDNSPVSQHCGNVYNVWTNRQSGTGYHEVEFVLSQDGALSFSPIQILSTDIDDAFLNFGANIKTGPDGEIYVVWSIFYDSWGNGEKAIGFTKSTNGGAAFEPAHIIFDNINGIYAPTCQKNHWVNSWPSMAVDISGGMYNGNIYIVWTNNGFPGINTGTNKSVYLIKSSDNGETWSDPIRVNQGPFDDGKWSYFSWITCDPVSGVLSCIFYDDRDVGLLEVETWVANSFDGGETWEDFRISDVSFAPASVPGCFFPTNFGDYLGIAALNGMVYPVWTDNRNGYPQAFISPYETNPRTNPTDLEVELNEGNGETSLSWNYTETETLQYFVIYRDNNELGTTTETVFSDNLPGYGLYQYNVTAMHEDGESSAAIGSVQWGNPDISVNPESLTETLYPDQLSTQILTINNIGELELHYNVKGQTSTKRNELKAYCTASGGGTEYISGVEFIDISNTGTGADAYADYTDQSTEVDAGYTYPITITNGGPGYKYIGLSVWIDWNQDEDFDDQGENPVCEMDNSGQGTYNITVPWNALSGQTKMRVRIGSNDWDCGNPCGYTSQGEVEDYSVTVNNWLYVENTIGTLAPGASDEINVIFNSAELEIGSYEKLIILYSNDPDEPTVEVPINLTVEEEISVFEPKTIELSVDMYPNPSEGLINIKIQSGYCQDIDIVVHNLLGAILKTEKVSVNKISNTTLDLLSLSSGLYLIKIKGDKVYLNRKIVIQK